MNDSIVMNGLTVARLKTWRRTGALFTGLAATALLAAPAAAHPIFRGCPADSVKAGDACIDTYEASVWQIPIRGASICRW